MKKGSSSLRRTAYYKYLGYRRGTVPGSTELLTAAREI